MPAAQALVASGILGGGNRATSDAATAYFNTQSPEDQAAIRASWNTPGQDRIAVGGGFTARPGSKIGDAVMRNQWYMNANNAGSVPPPPPVAPPPGPAQTAPVAGAAQPQPAPSTTGNQPASGGFMPPPAPWTGNAAAGATPIATMMTNNTFKKPEAPQPFDYETAKGQFGAARAREMEQGR